MNELKMINENYTYAKYKQLRLAKHMDITLEEIEDFYMTSEDLLKRNIEVALNSLRSQSLIFWNHSLTLCFIETHADKNMINQIKATKQEYTNEFNEETVLFSAAKPVSYRTYRKANKHEVELVLQAEREVLIRHNCESINDIFKRKLAKSFYKDVNEILFEVANIYYYFNSYEVIANEKYIYSKWEELEDLQLNTYEKETAKDTLNTDIVERINSNIEKRHLRSVSGVGSKDKITTRSNNDYVINGFKLTDTLINKDAISLKKSLESIKQLN
jgi:hypothetical protein